MADLVLVNGRILTMTEGQPFAQAVAIGKNRIIKVGTDVEIRSLIEEKTELIDLKGKTVVPGFIDTHVHVADYGTSLGWIDLTAANSIESLVQLLRNKAKKTEKGKWILGSGWNNEKLAEKRYPTRKDLDFAAPDNPAILYHESVKMCVVNSEAIRLSGLTKECPAPNEGVIGKNQKTGELTGLLEGEATDLVWSAVPEPTDQELLNSARTACEKIVEAGITSVHWITTSSKELKIAQRLTIDKSMALRIFIIMGRVGVENLGGKHIAESGIGGAVVFADGYLAAKTAALNEPYLDNPANQGRLLCSQEEMTKLASKISKAGLKLVIHAMGDRAINSAIRTLKELLSKRSDETRPRLEQAALLNKPLIQEINKLGIVVSIQPKVVESEFSVWKAIENLGLERARMLFPVKTLLMSGVCLIGGSDCPMEPLNPILGIQALVTRSYFPEERLTIHEALQLYTTNAAYSTNEEAEKGSIEVGKLADLTVLSEDPTSISADRLGEIDIEATIIDGALVYRKRVP